MKRKLNLIREALLLEADLSTGDNIIRAIERGQVSGVKKAFLTHPNKVLVKSTMDDLSEKVRELAGDDNYNRYIVHILSRSESFTRLHPFLYRMGIIVEVLDAYYGNVNKKEVKEDPKIKAKFDEIYNAPLSKIASSDIKNEFIKFVDITFAHKSKMTDEDITIHYRKGGWEIVIPKTFSAAKKYACMNNRKAQWCTSASLDSWKTYGGRKIYIIRNEKKNKMYQMDFGKDGGVIGSPSFNDEHNLMIKTETVKKEIPKHVLMAIKRDDGKTLYRLLFGEISDDRDEELTTDLNPHNKEDTPFKSLKALQKELSKFGYKVSFEYTRNLDEEYASSRLGNKQKAVGEIRASGKYTDGKNTFIYIIPKRGQERAFTFTLEDENRKKRVFRGATIFKVEKNKLIPFSLKNFLQYSLPEKLTRLLNDTNYVGDTWISSAERDIRRGTVDLRGEMKSARDEVAFNDLMGVDGTEEDAKTIRGAIDGANKRIAEADKKILLYNKNGLRIFKPASKLSSYLTIPGISNKELLQIKSLIFNKRIVSAQGIGLFFIYNKGVYIIDKSNPFPGMPRFRVEKVNKQLDSNIDKRTLGTEGGPGAVYPFRTFPEPVKRALYSFLMKSPETTFFPEALKPIKEKNEEIYNYLTQWVLKNNKEDRELKLLKDYGNGIVLYFSPKVPPHQSIFFCEKGKELYKYSYKSIVAMKRDKRLNTKFSVAVDRLSIEQMEQLNDDYEAGLRTVRFFLG